MKIIDTHIHLGTSRLGHGPYSEEDLLNAKERSGVYGLMVLPVSDPAPDARTAHDTIARFAAANRGHIWGVMDMNPKDQGFFKEEFERCVTQLGFKGIKIMSIMQGCEPYGAVSDIVFEMAQKYDIPVIFHTGEGIPWTLPSMMIPRAKEFPDVKIILAHGGTKMFFREAIIAAQTCGNIYLETSWCFVNHVRAMVKEVGVERMMWGSDGFANIRPSIVIAEEVGLPEKELERWLSGTASEVFKLDI